MEFGWLYSLRLKSGENLSAMLIKDDITAEKVFRKDNRLIFECEVAEYKLQPKNVVVCEGG